MLTTETRPKKLDVAHLRQEIVGIDQPVPLLNGETRAYINFDNAASTPAFRSVQHAVNECLEWYSSVHRGSGFKSLVTTQAYEQARARVAEFVCADPQSQCVIFGKNATECINKLANRFHLEPSDIVLISLMEHHSNDLPWRAKAQVEHSGVRQDGSFDIDLLRESLVRHHGRVRLVAITGASNVSGIMPPIHDIARLAHEHGSKILVDAAQLAPHRRVDMYPDDSPYHVDFLALSAHKMYAPFGTGALIGPKEFFRSTPPDYRGGGTIEVVTLDEVHWADPPDRDEAGSPNVIGAVALGAAIDMLTRIGMDTLAAHEVALARQCLKGFLDIPGIQVFGPSDPDHLDNRLGVISFSVEGLPHAKVAAILAFEHGIGVRSGCFCAHPYVLRLLDIQPDVFEEYKRRALQHDRSSMPGLVRVSLGCYNTEQEVEILIRALENIRTSNYKDDYVLDKESGIYFPRGFDSTVLNVSPVA